MDDSCAVCAEPLEWVAYGSCGHREVCSTCVSRLRFILNDPRCCICKNESPTVFVTKALGDYTRMINDFSVFPDNATEGQVGAGYWYHEDTQSFFDDIDHYKMIKAMCRLSCSICDRSADEQGNSGSRRKDKFKNIEQLKSHLYHRHRMLMCSLCLEGRKVFICEQKLYSRAQLNQHITTGDSEVDGSESERGGFMGHPMCEFCRHPFYGDNELYTHMSTEHFTCHICQRQHPGQYDYFKNYDDLEIHFRHEHFLCEDEACLTKKFIVFQSESEMKRHNAIEHGGHMSRSKRNAALQIPTSFRYRRSNENDQRRGRGRGFRLDSSDNQLSLAIQASFETAGTDIPIRDSSSSAQVIDHDEPSEFDAVMGPFDSMTITSDSDPPSRYLQAVSQRAKNASLEESSFPPLPVAQTNSTQKSKHTAEGSGKSTMASRLRVRNKGSVKILNSPHTRLVENQGTVLLGSAQTRSATNHGLSSSSTISAQTKPTFSSPAAIFAQTRPKNSSGSAGSSLVRPATDHSLIPPSSATYPWSSSSSVSKITHSVSAPNLIDRGSLNPSISSAVPLSRTEDYPSLPTNSRSSPIVEDVQTANKSLVERIRAGLGHSEDKYTAFKEISSEFRQGQINTWEYLAYVQQFGLSHLILELARLCPDPQKQRELIEAYNASLWSNGPRENGSVSSGSIKGKGKSIEVSNGSSKGKGKSADGAYSSAKDALADSIISTVRKLQENYKPSEEGVEVLPKDGYRTAKGKSEVSVIEELVESSLPETHPSGGSSDQKVGGGASSKQRRKTSKFHRMRLGDDYDLRNSDAYPEPVEEANDNPSEGGLPVSGVWKNGGGQRLVAKTQRGFSK